MGAQIIRLVGNARTGKLKPVAQEEIDAQIAKLESLLRDWHNGKR